MKEYNEDPFFKYTLEEKCKMTREEFCALIKEHNEYARKQHSLLKEQKPPRFNTVEELRAYYDCMPLDEAIKSIDSIIKNNG